jgi:hypothetical protein
MNTETELFIAHALLEKAGRTPSEIDDYFLAHYGVRGMRWGSRRAVSIHNKLPMRTNRENKAKTQVEKYNKNRGKKTSLKKHLKTYKNEWGSIALSLGLLYLLHRPEDIKKGYVYAYKRGKKFKSDRLFNKKGILRPDAIITTTNGIRVAQLLKSRNFRYKKKRIIRNVTNLPSVLF